MHTVDDLQSLVVSSQSERLEGGAETMAQVKINALEGELAGLNLRKVKNIGPVSSAPKSSEQFGWPDSRSIEKRV
jgi:hypothetical protein